MPALPALLPALSWRSLQVRLTLLSLGIVVCVLLALDMLVQQHLTHDLEQMLGHQQLTTVGLQAREIDKNLQDGLQALGQAAARLSEIQPHTPEALQSALESHPILPGLFNGGAFITDTQGMAVASYPRAAQRLGLNYRDRSHVATALQSGQAGVGKPAIGKALGTPTVSIAVPLHQAHGKVSGVLVGVIDLARVNFTSQVLSSPYGASGSNLLVANAWRTVVAGTDAHQTLRTLPAPGLTPALDAFVQGGQGVVRMNDLDGRPSLAAAAQIPSAHWTLLALLPQAEAFAPVHTLMRALVSATVVLTLAALLLQFWLVRRQLAPAWRASRALARQRSTDQEIAPLPVGRPDEIGRLIAGFNALLEVCHTRETRLRASEQALQSTTTQLEEAQRLAGLGHWALDLRSQTLQWSAEIYRMSERSPESFPPSYQNFLDAVHPDDRERVHQTYTRSLQERAPFEVEHRLCMADGRIKWVYERGATEFDAQGQAVRIQGTAQDISAKKQTENQLRQSLALLHNILNTVPMRIYWKDLELNYLGCNRLFAHDAGLREPQDIVGHSDFQLGWAAQAERLRTDDRALIAAGNAKPFYEDLMPIPAHQHLRVRTAKVPLKDSQGVIQGVLGVYYDITEQKDLAQALHTAHQQPDQPAETPANMNENGR